MKEFTIPCSEEQTRRALTLGAPIESQEFTGGELETDWFAEGDKCYHIPTSEQMMEWLRTKGVRFYIAEFETSFYWNVTLDRGRDNKEHEWGARAIEYREAAKQAIDAALEFTLS